MAKAPRVRKSMAPVKPVDNSTASISDAKKLSNSLKKIGIIRSIGNLFSIILWPFKKILSFLIPKYFVNSWKEVKLVSWPNRRETWRLTLAVLIFAIVFGSLVAGVDKGLDLLFKKVILK